MTLNITHSAFYQSAITRNAARRLLGSGGVHVTVTLMTGTVVAGELVSLTDDGTTTSPIIELSGYTHADTIESRQYGTHAIRSIRTTPGNECLQCDPGLPSPIRVDIAY